MADVVGRRNAHVSVVLSLTTRGTYCVLRETRSQEDSQTAQSETGREVCRTQSLCLPCPNPASKRSVYIHPFTRFIDLP